MIIDGKKVARVIMVLSVVVQILAIGYLFLIGKEISTTSYIMLLITISVTGLFFLLLDKK